MTAGMRLSERLVSARLADDGRPELWLTGEQRRARRDYLSAFGPSDHSPRPACPACGGDEAWVIARKDVWALPVDNLMCRGCGLVFKDPVLAPEGAARYYGDLSARLRGKDRSPAGLRALFENRARRFAPPRLEFARRALPSLAPGALVVELGTYDGGNLVPWREAGFRVRGYDVSDAAFGPGRAAGLDLRPAAADGVDVEEPPALVLMSHVIEHLSDPPRELAAARRMLAGGGHLFVEVPGLRREGLDDLLSFFMTEHNFSFDLAGLHGLMAASGFAPVAGDETVRAVYRPAPPAAGRPEGGAARAEELWNVLADAERRRGSGPKAAWRRLRREFLNRAVFPVTGGL